MTKQSNISGISGELVKNVDSEDVLRVKHLTRHMLDRIENYMIYLDTAKGQELREVEIACGIEFGTKNSLAEMLVFLADHLFRLGKTEDLTNPQKSGLPEEWHDERLSDRDVNLVKDFVERMNSRAQIEQIE